MERHSIETALQPGEQLLWTGEPDAASFHNLRWYTWPVTGLVFVPGVWIFVGFWQAMAVLAGLSLAGVLAFLLSPLFAVGLRYAVTDRRVLLWRSSASRPLLAIEPRDLVEVVDEPTHSGRRNLYFSASFDAAAHMPPRYRYKRWPRLGRLQRVGFYGVEDWQRVRELIEALRAGYDPAAADGPPASWADLAMLADRLRAAPGAEPAPEAQWRPWHAVAIVVAALLTPTAFYAAVPGGRAVDWQLTGNQIVLGFGTLMSGCVGIMIAWHQRARALAEVAPGERGRRDVLAEVASLLAALEGDRHPDSPVVGRFDRRPPRVLRVRLGRRGQPKVWLRHALGPLAWALADGSTIALRLVTDEKLKGVHTVREEQRLGSIPVVAWRYPVDVLMERRVRLEALVRLNPSRYDMAAAEPRGRVGDMLVERAGDADASLWRLAADLDEPLEAARLLACFFRLAATLGATGRTVG